LKKIAIVPGILYTRNTQEHDSNFRKKLLRNRLS